MYQIVIERKAQKEIESLPAQIRQSVIAAIASLKTDPRPFGVKKLVDKDGYRIRIRNYRILYTIDDALKIIAIYRVKHRREVYR